MLGPLVIAVLAATAPATLARSPRNANYTMDVRLDPATRLISGTQRLTWTNPTAHPTHELHYHLYYNAWRNDHSSFLRWRGERTKDVRPDEWAYSDVLALALADGRDLLPAAQFIQPDDQNPHDKTVLRVTLPEAVGPGETIEVDLTFEAKVPRTFARTGFRGDYYFLAQWFPKVGVFEADGTWNCHQFIQTEFFADFGVYDVTLRVPTDWVVGATGREQDTVTAADGTTAHRFVQADVHDFAWTTSPDFTVHTRRFDHDELPAVDMRLLLRPDHAGLVDRYLDATAAALAHYGSWWGPYPYGHITVVDPAYGSRTGGMEYPTLFTGGARWLAPAAGRSPEGVTVHEAGHQFWYGIVANNEFEDAWLDEGFNTYSTTRTMEAAYPEHALVKRYFDGFLPVVFSDIVPPERTAGADRYTGFTGAFKRDAMAQPSFLTGPEGYRINAYDKPAMTLRTLENYLGWETFQAVVSTYFGRFQFRHPVPGDFFSVAEEVSGQSLTWFWDQTFRSTNVFDYGVGEVRSRKVGVPIGHGDRGQPVVSERDGDTQWAVEVYVRRWGEGVFPVDVAVTFADGTRTVEHWDGADRWVRYSYTGPAEVERVEVDPDHVLRLDVDSTNNGWLEESQAEVAAAKWSGKWMIWVQQTLEAFAFFA